MCVCVCVCVCVYVYVHAAVCYTSPSPPPLVRFEIRKCFFHILLLSSDPLTSGSNVTCPTTHMSDKLMKTHLSDNPLVHGARGESDHISKSRSHKRHLITPILLTAFSFSYLCFFISQVQHIPVRIVRSLYTGQRLQDITHTNN